MSQSYNQKTEQIYRTIMDRLITEIKDEVLSEGCNEDMLKYLKSVSILFYLFFNF
jgi:hypothetical protein